MSTPLRDLLTTILFDPPARAEFAADPDGFLGDHGWGDLDGADVQAALGALADELPVERATLIAPALERDASPGGWPTSAIDGLHAAISAVDDGRPMAHIVDEPAGAGIPVEDDPTAGIDARDHLAADVDLDGLDVDLDGLDELAHVSEASAKVDGEDDGVADGFGRGDQADGAMGEGGVGSSEPDAPDDHPHDGGDASIFVVAELGSSEPDSLDGERFYDPTLDEVEPDLDRPDDPDDPSSV